MDAFQTLTAQIAACRLCAPRFAATASAHLPRPVVWFRPTALILVAGQAPGIRVHRSGIPFDDPSGDRLRAWMGLDRATFHDLARIAIVPMAFCFPGHDANTADLPPPPLCSATWHQSVMAQLPNLRLRLLIGGAAQRWHLGTRTVTVTATVAGWRDHAPHSFPLPHPSWRNTAWLRRNPWFETELLPQLQSRVQAVLKESDDRTG